MATKKEQKTAASAINSAKKNGKAKKAEATPADAITGHEPQVDRLIRAHFIKSEADQTFKDIEAALIDVATPEYQKRVKNGDLIKGVFLKGEAFPHVKVSYTDKFSNLKEDDKEGLMQAFLEAHKGDEDKAKEAFDAHFEEMRKVTMRDTSDPTIALIHDLLKIAAMLADDDTNPHEVLDKKGVESLRRKIRKAVGNGASVDFAEIFAADVNICAKKGMDHSQYKLPEPVRRMLKQNKPSTTISGEVMGKAAVDEAVREIAMVIEENLDMEE